MNIKRLVNKTIITFLFGFNFLVIQSNSSFSQAIDFKELDAFIDTAMQKWDVPGLAVGIIKNDSIIYSKGFGYRDLKSREKVTIKTLFSIASATKSFTATAAAVIVDENKIAFDDPLQKYFPDFKMHDSLISGKITLRDLLTHRSGIPRQKFFSINTPANRKDVRYCMKYFEPSQDFRAVFQYCNETYSVAGDMVAEIASTTWENLITDRILNPLNMTSTIFSVKDLSTKTDYAKPYIVWEEDPEEMDFHDADILGAAGCIISNADDLLKWVSFNLNNGKVGDSVIVNPKRLLQIQSPQIVIPGGSRSDETSYQNYGMGWFIDYYRGHLHIHHGGVLYGFSSMISFMPNEKTGVVILANLNGTPFTNILDKYIYDRLMNLEPIDYHNKTLAEYEDYKKQMLAAENNEEGVKAAIPPLPLEQYTGIYVSNGYGSLNVKKENDSLIIKLLKYDCPLNYSGNDEFELYHPVEHMGWKTIFNKDSENNIIGLSIEVNPKTKPVVFQKKIQSN